jgi:Fe(3+) dicitrate transport protein
MKYHALNLPKNILAASLLLAFTATPVVAEKLLLEAITITGDALARERETGSAHKIDEQALEQWNYNDIHRILEDVPGVNIRDEEGYGLRPNIGMRGADSNRSKKITLMEDGVLFAPAPYSAPAAYYFPIMARMQSVEVFKGPSAIKYGPYTVGGAINFVSRDIPSDSDAQDNGAADLALGSYGFTKLHSFYGDSSERFGWMIEGVHMRADGFKRLDGGGDTGFDKNDVLLKLRFNSDPGADVYHQFDVKLGYADEFSNETYLGLSQADFEANPVRRYASSQLDTLTWDHQQFSLSHFYDPGVNYTVNTTLYRREFYRSWDKINGFRNAPSLKEILANPDTPVNSVYFAVLTGQADSFSTGEVLLLDAARSYVSQGIQSELDWALNIAGVEHALTVGVRYHQDEIERNHTERSFLMRARNLVSDGNPQRTVTRNSASAQALAIYVQNEVSIGKLTLKGGFRNESIRTVFTNRLSNATVSHDDNVFMPGLGLNYALSPQLRMLGGVHKGFVPVQPGSGVEVQPEESINYEFGLRYTSAVLKAEAIGFFNDYSNLAGTCTFSSGCAASDLDLGFNAGEVNIFGLEAQLSKTFFATSKGGISVPVRFNYTYTSSEFKNSFSSPSPGLSNVSVGDELPNLPEHQFTLKVAADHHSWRAALAFKYVAEMRSNAGTGRAIRSERTDPQRIVDFSANYQLDRKQQVYFNIDNIFDEMFIASQKPFGVRPGKPRSFLVGYKVNF